MKRRLLMLVRACSTASKPQPLSSSSSWSYSRLLEQHPIKAKMISSGLIMGSGDFACQNLTREHGEEGEEEAAQERHAGFDLHRTAKFATMGSLIIGPTLHHWYSFLVHCFPGTTTTAASTLSTGMPTIGRPDIDRT